MKKVLTIILILVLGFGANFLAVLGLIALAFFVTHITLLWFAAAITVVVAFTALLNFVRKKLAKYAHGAVIILCAQLPSILFWTFTFAQVTVAVIFPSAIIMIAAFAVWTFPAGISELKSWWSEFGKRNSLMIKLNKWWNEPL